MKKCIVSATKEHKGRKGQILHSLCSLRAFVAILLLSSSAFAEEKFATPSSRCFAFAKPLSQGSGPDIGTFNTACELYKTKDFQGSENLFGEVAAQTEDEKLKARALYNQGTTLLAGTADGSISNRLEAVAEAITLFEGSLELKPDDLDAKQNLERALNWMVSGRMTQAEKLINEADGLLQQDQAKAAKENYETAKETLAPVEDDFDPNNRKVQPLKDRADGQLQMLDRAVEQTKEELKDVQHAIDMYEYQAAADVMLADSKERRWAFDIDQELGQEFQQMIQNNQNVINIVYPQNPLQP